MSGNRFTPRSSREALAARKVQREGQMWERFAARAAACGSHFEAFLIGWEEHRVFSARRRWRRKQARTS